MANKNRIITFQYAKNNWDKYKKQTIPDSLECMTKDDIQNYLNADMSVLGTYNTNQLIPRNKFLGANFPSGNVSKYPNNTVRDIYYHNDKIMVVGYFTQFGDISTNYFFQIDSNYNISNESFTYRDIPYVEINKIDEFLYLSGRLSSGAVDKLNDNLSLNATLDITSLDYFIATGVVKLTDGKFFVLGQSSNSGLTGFTLKRLLADWTVDNSFSILFNAPTGSEVSRIFTTSTGHYILIGSFQRLNNTIIPKNIVKVTSEGVRDNSFVGVVNGSNGVSMDSSIQLSDGNILLLGTFESFNGVTNKGLHKIDVNGNSIAFNYGSGFSGYPLRGAEIGGKIYIIGYFTSYNSHTANGIIRLNLDGTIDTTFNPGGAGFIGRSSNIEDSSMVYAIEPIGENKLAVGGDFMRYNGVDSINLIILNVDGSIHTTFN